MKRPIVIAVCGIDGCGKSTQINMLKKYLEEKQKTVNITKVKMNRTSILFDVSEKVFGDPYAYHPHIQPEVMNTVIACDVAYHYRYEVEKVKDCDYLLCDRHKLCYLAYTDAFGGEVKWIEEIMKQFPDPDITIYIRGNVELSTKRLMSRADKPIRTDENPEILSSALNAYEERIKEVPSETMITVGADDAAENIHAAIIQQLEPLLKKFDKERTEEKKKINFI
ncbi:dTMP kinase [[Clostridium] polysaccharolyticum]|uniref:Thymidylate kinase n=1 Tax=[Clostridium] polysaccharolyticum TaxID=29364 RepID=A0A1I0AR52_9FIRM|nr:deoxynucleoside kinase [[Clostridium] polysaccharolyticum]SES96892.1 Thymidylate kinase [[Clostridium] polysaccharolyticum]